jgi:hypothetical protein
MAGKGMGLDARALAWRLLCCCDVYPAVSVHTRRMHLEHRHSGGAHPARSLNAASSQDDDILHMSFTSHVSGSSATPPPSWPSTARKG